PRRGWIYYNFFSNVAWRYNLNNNVKLINKNFDKQESIRNCQECYYNKEYGFVGNLKNHISNLFRKYHYFEHYHQAQPFLKSIWAEATAACKDEVGMTISQRFRDKSGITAYLFRYWHLVSGKFVPYYENDFMIQNLQNLENIQKISDTLLRNKYRFVCLNDESFAMSDDDFVKGKEIIGQTLDRILPSKSSYEK
uniref:hypothetical protein n=1 Tax=Sulfurovum sp. TaxID=1969726 RepID=UPI0025EBF248